jgi:hypothetical protein
MVFLLIRRVRPGEEEPPDDGQDDDHAGGYPWADGRATRLDGPQPDVACVPADCVARGGA